MPKRNLFGKLEQCFIFLALIRCTNHITCFTRFYGHIPWACYWFTITQNFMAKQGRQAGKQTGRQAGRQAGRQFKQFGETVLSFGGNVIEAYHTQTLQTCYSGWFYDVIFVYVVNCASFKRYKRWTLKRLKSFYIEKLEKLYNLLLNMLTCVRLVIWHLYVDGLDESFIKAWRIFS